MGIAFLMGQSGGSSSKLDTTPPPPITSFTATSGSSNVILNWVNPTDTDFIGLKILRQTTTYPTSITDGVVVYAGANTSYTDTTITNGTTYYYRAFSYDWDNNYNTTTDTQQISCTPQASKIYGVRIDKTNSNPDTSVIYTDDAVGFTAMSGGNGTFSWGSWQTIFNGLNIKPCLFLNGAVNYYLNPNNFAQKADGVTASDITSGTDGDVMIEFPKLYFNITTTGNYIYVKFSTAKIDETYFCLAHLRGSTEVNNIYIAAYLGNLVSTKLRSLSGKTPTATQSLSTFRTQAQANGTNYQQALYYQILMLQVLYVVFFKNLDSQTVLGKGFTAATNTAPTATGGTNAKGMFWGSTSNTLQIKFCGIEDFYGNLYTIIDGLYSSSTRNILVGTSGFNNTGSGYTDYGVAAAANFYGYGDSFMGSTNVGFVPKTAVGSATTYSCDYTAIYAGTIPIFGGSWAENTLAGAFTFLMTTDYSVTSADLGGRLTFL